MHLREVDANLLVTLDALLVDASVTRAAERLGRSASAISHALAKLREIFADELFVRAGQRLVPTAKALELAPTVHVILAGMESLLRPSKPFDPSETSRDFAIATSEAAPSSTRHGVATTDDGMNTAAISPDHAASNASSMASVAEVRLRGTPSFEAMTTRAANPARPVGR